MYDSCLGGERGVKLRCASALVPPPPTSWLARSFRVTTSQNGCHSEEHTNWRRAFSSSAVVGVETHSPSTPCLFRPAKCCQARLDAAESKARQCLDPGSTAQSPPLQDRGGGAERREERGRRAHQHLAVQRVFGASLLASSFDLRGTHTPLERRAASTTHRGL